MTVTLLPEPDSPTMPSTSPSLTVNEIPSTAWTIPSSVRNETLRSRTSSSGSAISGHLASGSCSLAAKSKSRKDAGSVRSRRLRTRLRTPRGAALQRPRECEPGGRGPPLRWAHPWVKPRVDQIDQRTRQCDEEGAVDHRRHDDRQVEGRQRVVGEEAYSPQAAHNL